MTNTKNQPIEFVPGINKNNTSYGNEGRWINGDKIRFRDGKPRKIGGWQRQGESTFTGVARDIQSWTDLDSNKYLALATHKRIQILSGGTYFDVTPARADASVYSSAITATSGGTEANIKVSAHDAQVGDFIMVSSATTVAGNVFFEGVYEITSVPDVNHVIVDYGTTIDGAATSTGDVSVTLLLQNGLEYNQVAYGWGAGTYSTSAYGTPRTISSLSTKLRQWSFDLWGEDLLACNRSGKVYVWDETNSVGTRMQEISGSPSQNNFILVSYPTRHLISLGCVQEDTSVFDPMLVRWASQEDYTDWTTSATNTAGGQRLEHGNELIGAEPSKNDILVFTDTAAYSMRYVGDPFIFGFDLLGQEAGLVSQHAAANVDGVVYWMSDSAFYRYDGSLRTLACTVRDEIFNALDPNGLNTEQRDMVFCGVNQEFNEIIWFFPKSGSTKCDRYVIHNYLEDVWYDGSLERSVWEESNIFNKPYAANNDGQLYAHEQGKDDDGSPMQSYVESGMFDLDDGDYLMFIDKFIPDFNQVGNLSVTLTTRKYPQSDETVTKTYVISDSQNKLNVRAKGRQAALKLESNTNAGDWVLGKPLLAMKPSGQR